MTLNLRSLWTGSFRRCVQLLAPVGHPCLFGGLLLMLVPTNILAQAPLG